MKLTSLFSFLFLMAFLHFGQLCKEREMEVGSYVTSLVKKKPLGFLRQQPIKNYKEKVLNCFHVF
jgi:hypothetical protein